MNSFNCLLSNSSIATQNAFHGKYFQKHWQDIEPWKWKKVYIVVNLWYYCLLVLPLVDEASGKTSRSISAVIMEWWTCCPITNASDSAWYRAKLLETTGRVVAPLHTGMVCERPVPQSAFTNCCNVRFSGVRAFHISKSMLWMYIYVYICVCVCLLPAAKARFFREIKRNAQQNF